MIGHVHLVDAPSARSAWLDPDHEPFVGWCSLCEWDVMDLPDHQMLHFEQWDVERVLAFVARVHPNDAHVRRLCHPLASTQGPVL